MSADKGDKIFFQAAIISILISTVRKTCSTSEIPNTGLYPDKLIYQLSNQQQTVYVHVEIRPAGYSRHIVTEFSLYGMSVRFVVLLGLFQPRQLVLTAHSIPGQKLPVSSSSLFRFIYTIAPHPVHLCRTYGLLQRL